MKTLGKVVTKTMMYSIMLFIVLFSVFPVLWVIFSSFKTNGQILAGPFVMPSSIDFSAYRYLFEKFNFMTYFYNSLFVSIVPSVASLMIYAMAAYVIAKYEFPGKHLFFTLFTITILVPTHARIGALFSLIMRLGLYDTKAGLALVYMSFGMALSMFILKGTFQSIPKELNEAAIVDGAGFFRIFWSVNLPLARNGLVTAGVLMFLTNWNEFYYALLLTASQANRTLPIITTLFNTQFSYDYQKTFAALALLILPGIIIYAVAQEQVQASLASGAVKG